MTDVIDSFNRANGPLGSTWLNSTGLTGGSGIVINGNEIWNLSETYRAVYWAPSFATFDNDQYAQIDTTGNNSAGVVVRHNVTGTSNFYAAIRANGINYGGGQNLYLYRCSGGKFTLLGSFSGLPGGSGTVGLRATGQIIVASYDGGDKITVTDAFYAGGQPGIILSFDVADNFAAGPAILHKITAAMAANEAADAFAGTASLPLGLPGSQQFYFAWCNETDKFGASMVREDELIFNFELQHDEGQFCELTIEIANPYVGLLASGRLLWAWFSWNDGTVTHPLFFGRLVGIPDDLFGQVIKLKLLAKPSDYSARLQALAETLKVLPYYDPIWIDANKLDDPDTILEGYSALWNVDRLTHEVTISDIINGEDGMAIFTQGDVFYDKVEMKLAGAPLLLCEINAEVNWTQCSPDQSVNIKTVAGLSGDPNSPGRGLSVPKGVGDLPNPPEEKEQTQTTFKWDYKNLSSRHNDGDLMEESGEVSVPFYGGDLTKEDEKITNPDATTGQGEEYSIARTYKEIVVGDLPSHWLSTIVTDPPPGQPPPPSGFDPSDPVPGRRAPATIKAEVQQDRKETIYVAMRADVQPVLAQLTEDEKNLRETISMQSRDLAEVGGAATSEDGTFFPTGRGHYSVEYLLMICRAHLLAGARVVSVDWESPFSKMINLTTRMNASIEDPRLPGSMVSGKIVSYKMTGDGDSGAMLGSVTINCAVGNGGSAVADAGVPIYVDEGYVSPGYQHYDGSQTVTISDDVTFDNLPFIQTGLQFPLTEDQILVRHEYIDGSVTAAAVNSELLASGARALREFKMEPIGTPLKAGPPPQVSAYIGLDIALNEALNQAVTNNPSWVEMEFKPVQGIFTNVHFSPNVGALKVPKQIDLAAS
jgi:hypothetical protein